MNSFQLTHQPSNQGLSQQSPFHPQQPSRLGTNQAQWGVQQQAQGSSLLQHNIMIEAAAQAIADQLTQAAN